MQLLLAMAVIGPGLITATVDNDAGGIATYSAAGARFGNPILWTLVPAVLILALVQEMGTRMGVATEKGLGDLIRERFGARVTVLLMLVVLVVNFGNTLAEFAGLAQASEIFGVTRFLAVPLAALFVWWLVVRGNYQRVEKVFLVACVFYIAYVVSGFLARPDWAKVFGEAATLPARWDSVYVGTVVGLIGTTIAPWMQFYLQAAVVEKQIPAARYGLARLDAVLGSVATGVVAFFIVVTCAGQLYPKVIGGAAEAAVALRPLAGVYCSKLFAFGLLNASLFAACILPLSTAYTFCEGIGWQAGVSNPFREAPHFYGLYAALIILGGGCVLIPGFPLFRVMLVSQIANGVLLPIILVYMLILIRDRGIMGPFASSRLGGFVGWATTVALTALTVVYLYTLIRA